MPGENPELIAFLRVGRYNGRMRIFKMVFLLFVCLSLFAGGMANAAMTCCVQPSAMATMQVEKASADMPCHQQDSKKTTQSNNACEKCEKCVATGAVLPSHRHDAISFPDASPGETVASFVSITPRAIYSPPKRLS